MFITLEGIDGSGKTTATAEIERVLKAAGIRVTTVKEPGYTRLGRMLRELLLTGKATDMGICPKAELFLYLAARAQTVTEVIQPLLRAGYVVVSDRYIDTTLAYKGAGQDLRRLALEEGWDVKPFNELVAWSGNGLWPDLTLFFRLDPFIGISRSLRDGNKEVRFEGMGTTFMEIVAEEYDKLFPPWSEETSFQNGVMLGGRDPGLGKDLYWNFPSLRPPYRIIDASLPLDEVLAHVRRIMEDEVIPVLKKGGAHENDRLHDDSDHVDAPDAGVGPGSPTNAGNGGTGGTGEPV